MGSKNDHEKWIQKMDPKMITKNKKWIKNGLKKIKNNKK